MTTHPTGEFHGQECLVGPSPWGGKELDVTESRTNRHTHTHTQPSRHQKPWCVRKLSSPPDVLAVKLGNHQDFSKTI